MTTETVILVFMAISLSSNLALFFSVLSIKKNIDSQKEKNKLQQEAINKLTADIKRLKSKGQCEIN